MHEPNEHLLVFAKKLIHSCLFKIALEIMWLPILIIIIIIKIIIITVIITILIIIIIIITTTMIILIIIHATSHPF